MRGGEKAKDFKGTIGKLFRYIGKYKAAVVVVAIICNWKYNIQRSMSEGTRQGDNSPVRGDHEQDNRQRRN